MQLLLLVPGHVELQDSWPQDGWSHLKALCDENRGHKLKSSFRDLLDFSPSKRMQANQDQVELEVSFFVTG